MDLKIRKNGESYIIDVQHWRHYFLIMGVLWGLMVAAAVNERGDGVAERPMAQRRRR